MALDAEAVSELIVNPLLFLRLPLELVALTVLGMLAGRVLNDRRKLFVVAGLIGVLMVVLLEAEVNAYGWSLEGDRLIARRSFCPSALAEGTSSGRSISLVALAVWAALSVAIQFLFANFLARRRRANVHE